MFIQRFETYAMFFLVFAVSSNTLHASDYMYTVVNGDATISQYMGAGGDVIIPDTLDGFPVVSIGMDAFRGNSSLTSVVIPDSVTNIRNEAFMYCYGLANAKIGNGLTFIEGYLFSRCTNLVSVVIGNNVSTIGHDVFNGCSRLANVTIPNSVKTIGEVAFRDCSSMTNITVGNGVTAIDANAFLDCISLTSAYFLGDAPSINTTFGLFGYGSIATVYRLDGAAGWPEVPTSWAGRPTALWEAYFTLHLSTGGDFIYWPCKYKQLVFISANEPAAGKTFERWIGDTQYVASATSAMTTVTMPSQDISIMPLYRDAFTYATNADYTVTVTKYIAADGHVAIPDTVGGLPVTCVGASAFSGCTSLTNITVTANVTNIGERAFAFCPQLERIDFFGNAPCFGPDTEIFYESNLTVYHLQGTTGWDATYSGRPTAVIAPWQFISHNGQITVTKYLSGIVGEALVIPGTINGLPVSYIDQDAFRDCTNIASVVFPDSVIKINETAFAYCRGLTNVTFGSGMAHIGRYAFLECNNLASVTIPESVSVVDVYAFSGTGLTSVRIPDGVNTLGQGAFRYCSCLTNVTIGAGVTTLENFTFAACGNLV